MRVYAAGAGASRRRSSKRLETPVNQLDVLPPGTRTLLHRNMERHGRACIPPSLLHPSALRATGPTHAQCHRAGLRERVAHLWQLNARANRLAHHLIPLGVRPEDRVALCMERGIGMVVALLAMLKAGGAYVPLDPAYSGERLNHILTDSAPPLLVARRRRRPLKRCGDTGALAVLDPNATLGDAQPDDNPQTVCRPASPRLPDLHLRLHRHAQGRWSSTPRSCACSTQLRTGSASMSAMSGACSTRSPSISRFGVVGALRYGGKLVIVPQHVARFAPDFLRLLQQEGVTVLNQTPSAFRASFRRRKQTTPHCVALCDLRRQALNPSTLEPWYARH